MNNGEYWQKRFELLEQAAHQQGVQCYADIEKQYRQAQKTLEGQIAAWYQRFASNNGVTLAEAKRMLNAKELAELKWDVNQYIQYGQENAINGTWVKQLENASARFHISRLEALKLQTQQSIEVMFGNQLDSIDSTMRNVYKSGYYHTAYEIQKGVGVGWDFSALDDKQISKVINKPWAVDGKNFSERIWGNRQKLVNELNNTLTQNIILGKDPQKAIDEIARKMNTSKTNAGRLVMTEEAFFSSAAQKDCFTELDVEQFEIVATLDSHTSDICRGMDGKHFPMSEWKVGVTAPPFHVHCRSTTVPYFDDEFDAVGERAARDEETGKTYFVPGNMTYKEWEKSFVNGSDKSDLKAVNADDSAIAEYTASRKEYDTQVQRLAELEKETDNALDAYMDVMDTPQAAEYEAVFNKKFDETESLKQIVKDLKATLSGKEAKAVRQVEKNLAVKSGISIDNVEMTGLEYDTADMVYGSYKTVLNKYPELKGQLVAFKYDGVKGDAYAGCIAMTGEVKAHGLFAKYDRLVKTYANDVAAGFHPIGTDHNSIIVHELGHALDGYMTKKGLLGGVINPYGIIRSSVDVQKQVLEQLGWNSEYLKKLKESLKAQGFTHPQIVDKINEQRKEFITRQVSEYAADNEKEFFAECFAEYVMSDKPRKAAQIFGTIIDDALGR
jgi:SPP1 gp7 family putative phage head morphogenesis protein